MKTLRKWWRPALAVFALLMTLQVAVTLLARTHRLHSYLVGHLERSFGRPVEVESFDVRFLPSPQLDAHNITVGEDPAFGYEYFLRAERLSAGLRWTGLLGGHFEFGTLSLSKPSLILVRNSQRRWNLEKWLPPARSSVAQDSRVYGPPSPPAPVHHLNRLEFDEGRINFKVKGDKLPFAFIDVSGSVEQVSSGRWQLQLEAQPWRSGVSLQSAGIIRVRGDVAGTSARLQPAEVTLHWSGASLADVFRLFRGQDLGVRGVFALDAMAKSGISKEGGPEDWTFSVEARAGQIHRWDLTDRPDNPRLNVSARGRWNVGAHSISAEQVAVEAPSSNLRGVCKFLGGEAPALELRLDSMGIQASDLLTWYRAFHADVAEGLTADQYFTGGILLRGWPLSLDSAALSSNGGIIRVPGFRDPLRIGPVSGGRERSDLVIGPVRVTLGGDVRDIIAPKRRRAAWSLTNGADVTLTQHLTTPAGGIAIEGNLLAVQDFLKLSAALGHKLNHGWELSGQATALAKWEWEKPFTGLWNGSVSFNKATLNVAGLNQPLNISEGAITWSGGRRTARVSRVEGFGGTWTGTIEQNAVSGGPAAPDWKFHLIVDQLDAAVLDRWVGPRARPSWLQQLLPSLLGGTSAAPPASELVRRVNAEGELDILLLTVEKLKFGQVRAKGSLHDLQLDVNEADAQWAGGKLHAKFSAKFLPRPGYDITADLDHVNLALVPWSGRLAERTSGVTSGTVHLATQGVGREELLAKLSGQGDLHLNKVELRGWDVNASLTDGAMHAGISRWPAGEVSFQIKDRNLRIDDLRLDGAKESTLVNGTLSFARNADLAVETADRKKGKARASSGSAPSYVLKISGPLDGPKISVERQIVRQPAD